MGFLRKMGAVSAVFTLASCSEAHSTVPNDAGSADASVPIPGEIRTLRVGENEYIGWLAVDSNNNLCALVRTVGTGSTLRDWETHYGCFDASDNFVSRALIATGPASAYSLTLDRDDNPSMIVSAFEEGIEFVIAGVTHSQASCAVRLEDTIWSECVEQPFFLNSFAYNDRTGEVAASILNEERPGMLGTLEVTPGIYLASGLPINERSQLHRFTESNIGPRAIFAADDGGWFVGGDYFSAPPEWMLPESPPRYPQTPFWARLDRDLNPIEAHAYPGDASANSWSVGSDGRPIGIASSFAAGFESPRPSYFVGDGFETWVPIGQGGFGSVAASRNTIAVMLGFDRGPMTVGTFTFEPDPRRSTQVLATFTRTGELLTARQVPGWASNVVFFADDSIAYSDGNVVHVLTSR